MRTSRFMIILLAILLCFRSPILGEDATTDSQLEPVSALHPENLPGTIVSVLSDEELQTLLNDRIKDHPSGTFAQFGNQFLVNSRIQLGKGVALATPSRKIALTRLQSPYPDNYEPRLRELLDFVALQAFAEWKYESTGKYIDRGDGATKPVRGLAVFEFKEEVREKPYQIEVAKGWTVRDRGNWVMYTPPDFHVGMDIYEAGVYSIDNKRDEKDFLEQIQIDVSLMWALRANANATVEDLKLGKVGRFDASSYDTMIRSKEGQKFRWRHWVFLDGAQCYFIVCTIPPHVEEELFPEIQRMLNSFEIKRPEAAR